MISTHELARACGVSQGTVDRVLHERPGVSDATRRKILAAAAKHGYQPHPAARELLTGERRVVGAIVPAVNNIFFMDLMTAIGEKLMGQGLRFFLTPVRDPTAFIDVISDFAARRSRAVIAAPPADDIAIPASITADLKVITVAGRPCRGSNLTHVDPDEFQKGFVAANYLVAQGHKRIAHVTYGFPSQARRMCAQGFCKAMRDHGLEGAVIRADHDEEVAQGLRRHEPTAVFCQTDVVALWVIRMLGTMGRRVPDDVSVMGADRLPTFAELHPGLTSLSYPLAEVASCVVSLITEGKPVPIPDMEVAEGQTVIRH